MQFLKLQIHFGGDIHEVREREREREINDINLILKYFIR
jgi:hypothetical protein